MDNQELRELRELVNPVFNTAKSCVQLDAATGDEDAKLLLGALGLSEFGTKVSNASVPPELVEQVKRLEPAYKIVIEGRYKTMMGLIDQRKDRQIVDLPCGYTSRGIRMARQKRTYYGFDLPAVIDDIRPAVESIIGKSDAISYCAVDATNFESLEAGLGADARNLMVTTEGLLMYFIQSELEEVFSNIHRILKKRGGSWVISDRAIFVHDQELVEATLAHDPQLCGLYAAITKKAASSTADVELQSNVFFDPDTEKVKDFITRMGFELHEISMADYLPEHIFALDDNPEVEPDVREVFKKMMFWELTVADKTTVKATATDANLAFKVTSETRGKDLFISIQGRMDTITAPELLAQFRSAGDGFEAIQVDVSRMPYVSSAGLRVLMIMFKSLPDPSRFEIVGVTDGVREIFDTTGFSDFFF